MLVKNNSVEFAGYTIPHPMDNVMNLRVQTKKVLLDSVEDVYQWTLAVLKDKACAQVMKDHEIQGEALFQLDPIDLKTNMGFSDAQATLLLDEIERAKPVPATTALVESLDHLTVTYQHILKTFQEAVVEYETGNGSKTMEI